MISIACISCVDLFTSCLIHCCNSPHGEWSSIKILLSVFSKVLVRWSWKRQRGQDNGVESVGVNKYHDHMQALKPFSLTMQTGGDSEPLEETKKTIVIHVSLLNILPLEKIVGGGYHIHISTYH